MQAIMFTDLKSSLFKENSGTLLPPLLALQRRERLFVSSSFHMKKTLRFLENYVPLPLKWALRLSHYLSTLGNSYLASSFHNAFLRNSFGAMQYVALQIFSH